MKISNIGHRIKEVRKSKGLSQYDFAEGLGIKQGHISKIETGKGPPSDQLIKLIARTYGISEEWLRDGIGQIELQEEEKAAVFLDEFEVYMWLIAERFNVLNELMDGIIRESGHLKEFDSSFYKEHPRFIKFSAALEIFREKVDTLSEILSHVLRVDQKNSEK
jgi:transcriptional regulator with XRE-family HTH domain